jgi:hypothetical protein
MRLARAGMISVRRTHQEAIDDGRMAADRGRPAQGLACRAAEKSHGRSAGGGAINETFARTGVRARRVDGEG